MSLWVLGVYAGVCPALALVAVAARHSYKLNVKCGAKMISFSARTLRVRVRPKMENVGVTGFAILNY